MDPIMAGLISAGGGLIQNLMGKQNQKDAQAFNAQQASNQMAFQERMANTAYQRAMGDMKQAGLNPILAYQKGPASSPTGAAASTTPALATDFLSPAVSSAQHGQRLNYEVENMKQQNLNMKATENLTKQTTLMQGSQKANIDAQTLLTIEALSQAKKQAEIGQIDIDIYKRYPWLRTIGTFGEELGRILSPTQTGKNILIRPKRGGIHIGDVLPP